MLNVIDAMNIFYVQELENVVQLLKEKEPEEAVALASGVSVEEVAAVTTGNAKRLFAL